MALYTTLLLRHLLPTGHADLSLQLQLFTSFSVLPSSLRRILALCALIIPSILMVQEYDSLTVFLLNSRWKGCCLGKWTRSRLKNSFPIFVNTFMQYGGLNHTVFLLRFFVRSGLFFSASYFSSWWYPTSVKARWYWSLASVNSLSQLEMVFNLF